MAETVSACPFGCGIEKSERVIYEQAATTAYPIKEPPASSRLRAVFFSLFLVLSIFLCFRKMS